MSKGARRRANEIRQKNHQFSNTEWFPRQPKEDKPIEQRLRHLPASETPFLERIPASGQGSAAPLSVSALTLLLLLNITEAAKVPKNPNPIAVLGQQMDLSTASILARVELHYSTVRARRAPSSLRTGGSGLFCDPFEGWLLPQKPVDRTLRAIYQNAYEQCYDSGDTLFCAGAAEVIVPESICTDTSTKRQIDEHSHAFRKPTHQFYNISDPGRLQRYQVGTALRQRVLKEISQPDFGVPLLTHLITKGSNSMLDIMGTKGQELYQVTEHNRLIVDASELAEKVLAPTSSGEFNQSTMLTPSLTPADLISAQRACQRALSHSDKARLTAGTKYALNIIDRSISIVNNQLEHHSLDLGCDTLPDSNLNVALKQAIKDEMSATLKRVTVKPS